MVAVQPIYNKGDDVVEPNDLIQRQLPLVLNYSPPILSAYLCSLVFTNVSQNSVTLGEPSQCKRPNCNPLHPEQEVKLQEYFF